MSYDIILCQQGFLRKSINILVPKKEILKSPKIIARLFNITMLGPA